MDLSALGMKIKSERKRQGMTLEALSERVEISRNFLWEIEAGRKAPALATLYNLSIALNISIDYLMGTSSEKKCLIYHQQVSERELEISKIMSEINRYGTKELLLISSLIKDCSRYFDNK